MILLYDGYDVVCGWGTGGESGMRSGGCSWLVRCR